MRNKIDCSVMSLWLIQTEDKRFTEDNNKGYNGDMEQGLFLRVNTSIPDMYVFTKPINDLENLINVDTHVLCIPKEVFVNKFKLVVNFRFYCN
jgi:hypothetical protein